MSHDPEIYPDPMVFNPERFLGENPQMDPADVTFGFGRRICPDTFVLIHEPVLCSRITIGRVLADASMFISCAMVLAVYDITSFIENGVPDAPLSIEQKAGTVR